LPMDGRLTGQQWGFSGIVPINDLDSAYER
jgi:hypothetical protein